MVRSYVNITQPMERSTFYATFQQADVYYSHAIFAGGKYGDNLGLRKDY